MVGSPSSVTTLPEWLEELSSRQDALFVSGLGDLATTFAEAASALRAERSEVSHELDEFFFGARSVLLQDGGHLIAQVKAGESEDAGDGESPLRVEIDSGAHPDAASCSRDVETGIPLDDLTDESLMSLRVDRTKSCASMRASFPWMSDVADYLEVLVRLGGKAGELGVGGQFIAALKWMWPATVGVIAPFGRADLVQHGPCVRFRAALNYKVLENDYASVAEYFWRLKRGTITLMDESLKRIMMVFELCDDTLQVTIGVKDGRWVYLSQGSRGVWQYAKSDSGSDDVESILVPSPLHGSGVIYALWKDLRVRLNELGCSSLDLPTFLFELEHRDLMNSSASDVPDIDGHEWNVVCKNISSPGMIVESLMKPFFNLSVYRLEVYEKAHFSWRGGSGASRFNYRAVVPVPKTSSALVRFVQWWIKRQSSQMDLLRFGADVATAWVKDFKKGASRVASEWQSFLSECGTFQDAMSDHSWFSRYRLEREQHIRCVPQQCWRWLVRLCCCKRRIHQDLHSIGSFFSLDGDARDLSNRLVP
eukprot:TRINITY_DN10263_c0_g1_i1.p1 TRINITY_DN10263_c0_g1~~TRINITY_DN10263_c0_g1_i1.p1  ORF type:complete len:536 (-),score=54.11 TRINITY_DN10263_c0_g1_i1:201-1808(-)